MDFNWISQLIRSRNFIFFFSSIFVVVRTLHKFSQYNFKLHRISVISIFQKFSDVCKFYLDPPRLCPYIECRWARKWNIKIESRTKNELDRRKLSGPVGGNINKLMENFSFLFSSFFMSQWPLIIYCRFFSVSRKLKSCVFSMFILFSDFVVCSMGYERYFSVAFLL